MTSTRLQPTKMIPRSMPRMGHTKASLRPACRCEHMDMADDVALLRLLRAGDECAFGAVVERYRATMLRIAMRYISDRAIAEEVVQDAWIGILSGLRRFEGRSSLKTWMFSIVSNRAKTSAQRETRALPFSLLAISPEGGSDEPLRDPDAFPWRDDDGELSQHWTSTSQHWEHLPEEHLAAQETFEHTRRAIACLPPAQRQVLILRDIEGWTSDDVCRQLHVTISNQRVLLHRARARVREALERYSEDDSSAMPASNQPQGGRTGGEMAGEVTQWEPAW